MTADTRKRPLVACMRSRDDFDAVGAPPPENLDVRFFTQDDGTMGNVPDETVALVLASVGPHVHTEALQRLRSLRLIHFTGVGIDRVERDALVSRGVEVRGCPAVNAEDVAEYTITTAVALLRRLVHADWVIKAGSYSEARRDLAQPPLRGLRGLVWGIVGFGMIGRAVAGLANAHGCSVIYHDTAAIHTEDNAVSMPLDTVLQTADVVSIHVPLLPSTRGLIGRHQVALLGPDAVLINAGRGGVVDEHAVRERLEAGTLFGAAFDVYEHEPPAEGAGILGIGGASADRTLLTPHIAGVTQQAWRDLFTYTWSGVEQFLEVRPDSNGVNEP